MKRKNSTGYKAAAAPNASRAVSGEPTADSSQQEPTKITPIDFHTAEFNVVDDLDDNIGNYRSFRSLAGIVTADMRHHEERKRKKSAAGANADPLAAEIENQPGNNMAGRDRNTPPVKIVSRGRVLIIDTDVGRAARCGDFLNERGLTCTLCTPTSVGADISLSRIGSLPLVRSDSVAISGSFGGFKALVPAEGGQRNLAGVFGYETDNFDLVLDLQPEPAYAGKQLPTGYYAPGDDGAGLDAALAELPEMRGRFTKPQFAVFRANRCLHGRSRTHDCLRCLKICPVEAISSKDRKIYIDPYICQGCGGCALVCPADAIQLMNPRQEELLAMLRDLLTDSFAGSGTPPALILSDRNIDDTMLRNLVGNSEKNMVSCEIEEIGRIGLEMMLSTLAYGAGSVTVVCDRDMPAEIRQALEQQARLGMLILQGLDQPPDRIRFQVQGAEMIDPEDPDFEETTPVTRYAVPSMAPATFSTDHDKRTLTRLAVQHLAEASGLEQSFIPLPAEAPFGGVAIEAEACTLCMTCAGVCPSGALEANGETPRLTLMESRCHQCGLCVEACPEDAVQLLPRLLSTVEAADTLAVLRETEPFRCLECGEPFASEAMIHRMEEKLTGHWMYGSDRQRRRLRMCRTCRTRDALIAKDF
jgi:ferredoxin